jgi:hypothetical protein
LVNYSGQNYFSCTYSATGNDIETDENNNIYFTGSFGHHNIPGTITFGSIQIATYGGHDFYIVKTDSNGNVIWAKHAGSSTTNSYEGGRDLLYVDGNIYATGYYMNTATFGTVTKTNLGGTDGFLIKYDKNGTFKWVTTLNSPDYEYITGLAADIQGNIYAGINVQGSYAIMQGSTFYNSVNTKYDGGIVKLSSSGTLLKMYEFHGNDNDYLSLAAPGPENSILFGGSFNSSNLQIGNETFNSLSSSYDPYIGKLTYKPIITINPHSQTLSIGDTATFTVSATGSNLSYQWQKNNSNISGATNDTLIMYGVQTSDAGNYRCIVSNTYGADTSDQAYLNVLTLDSGLVAYYPFSGNTGDSSGNGYHGSRHGVSTTKDRFGLFDHAFEFNGGTIPNTSNTIIQNDEYLKISNFNYSFGAISINFWIKIDSNGESIIHRRNQNNIDFSIDVNSSDLFAVHFTQGSITSTSTIQKGKWYNLCVTNDGNELCLYINGELEKKLFGNFNIGNNSTELFMGKYTYNGSSTHYFFYNGLMDDVRIYNRALTPYEISQLYGNFDNPNIINQPISQSASIQDTVNFIVEATGSNLSYQWQKNNSNISGATNDTLIIYGAQTSDAGNYRCIVSNSYGADTSDVASLNVNSINCTNIYNDDFSGSLSNWENKYPSDNNGSWTINGNNQLYGNYGIGCGGTSCTQADLILKDPYQVADNWKIKVQILREEAYSGVEGCIANFSMWSNTNSKF